MTHKNEPRTAFTVGQRVRLTRDAQALYRREFKRNWHNIYIVDRVKYWSDDDQPTYSLIYRKRVLTAVPRVTMFFSEYALEPVTEDLC